MDFTEYPIAKGTYHDHETTHHETSHHQMTQVTKRPNTNFLKQCYIYKTRALTANEKNGIGIFLLFKVPEIIMKNLTAIKKNGKLPFKNYVR
jgi:hypothetical protein